MSDEKRVFSEKQASEILARAAHLQEAKGEGAYAAGLTREEVLSIASEAGISPENVEQAIRALADKKESGFLNLIETDERVVDAELDPQEFDVILEVAKPFRSRHRPVHQVGRTLSMQTRYKGGLYRVEVVSRNGRTRIVVTSVPLLAYLLSLHPALLVGIMAAGAFGAPLIALASTLAGLAGFVGLVRHGKANTGELADRIEKRIREATHDVRANLRNAEPIATSENVSIEAH